MLDETESKRRRVALKRACLAKLIGVELDRWPSWQPTFSVFKTTPSFCFQPKFSAVVPLATVLAGPQQHLCLTWILETGERGRSRLELVVPEVCLTFHLGSVEINPVLKLVNNIGELDQVAPAADWEVSGWDTVDVTPCRLGGRPLNDTDLERGSIGISSSGTLKKDQE